MRYLRAIWPSVDNSSLPRIQLSVGLARRPAWPLWPLRADSEPPFWMPRRLALRAAGRPLEGSKMLPLFGPFPPNKPYSSTIGVFVYDALIAQGRCISSQGSIAPRVWLGWDSAPSEPFQAGLLKFGSEPLRADNAEHTKIKIGSFVYKNTRKGRAPARAKSNGQLV